MWLPDAVSRHMYKVIKLCEPPNTSAASQSYASLHVKARVEKFSVEGLARGVDIVFGRPIKALCDSSRSRSTR